MTCSNPAFLKHETDEPHFQALMLREDPGNKVGEPLHTRKLRNITRVTLSMRSCCDVSVYKVYLWPIRFFLITGEYIFIVFLVSPLRVFKKCTFCYEYSKNILFMSTVKTRV